MATTEAQNINATAVASASVPSVIPTLEAVEHNPLARAFDRWPTLVNRDNRLTVWSRFNNEPNASSFATLLERLQETAQGRHPAKRQSLAGQIDDALDELEKSLELRATCFVIAEVALARCVDRVALGFEYIQEAIVNHKAERGDFTEAELLALGKRKFRRCVVDQVVSKKVETMQAIAIDPEEDVDQTEVELAYRTGLKGRLDLPGMVDNMDFFAIANVSQEDLDQAFRLVQSLESSPEMHGFICDYEPWKLHLNRTHAKVFEDNLKSVMEEMDRFSVPPPGMSDGDYMKKCDELVKQKEAIEKQTVRELTESIESRAL